MFLFSGNRLVRLRRFVSIVLVCFVRSSVAVLDNGNCLVAATVVAQPEYRVVVTEHVVKKLKPHFFGFNLEWVGFQEDFWDKQAMAVKPEVIAALRAFPGAVYRYPGGTVANHFNWLVSVGPRSTRPAKRAVEWKGPIVAHFGFREYLDLLSAVQGQAKKK